jgi:uncharacterized RDD family membrane protein YckC
MSDFLRHEYTIDTPENVSFGYEVAGIGSRFIGALVDLLAVGLLLALANVALAVLLGLAGGLDALFVGLDTDSNAVVGLIIAAYALVQFAIVWGYFLVFELAWNGQTPGKALAGTRVVRLDGQPAGFLETAVRNLVRFVDFLPTAYAAGFVTMLCNARSRRLGDYAAGTLVVREGSALTLAGLGRPARGVAAQVQLPSTTTTAPVAPAPEDSDAVGGTPDETALAARRLAPDDYRLAREALARYRAGSISPDLLRRAAAAVAARAGIAPAPADPTAAAALLERLVAAYEDRS